MIRGADFSLLRIVFFFQYIFQVCDVLNIQSGFQREPFEIKAVGKLKVQPAVPVIFRLIGLICQQHGLSGGLRSPQINGNIPFIAVKRKATMNPKCMGFPLFAHSKFFATKKHKPQNSH